MNEEMDVFFRRMLMGNDCKDAIIGSKSGLKYWSQKCILLIFKILFFLCSPKTSRIFTTERKLE
jgi:hypothetical protein